MQLTAEELAFMKAGGNRFMTVADPVDHDRQEVLYPAGIQVYPDRNTFSWLAEQGREYEPLAAGFGRYAIVGACKYLATGEGGWEYCSVYEQRPGVCQDFEVGSRKCMELREVHGVSNDSVLLPDPQVRRTE